MRLRHAKCAETGAVCFPTIYCALHSSRQGDQRGEQSVSVCVPADFIGLRGFVRVFTAALSAALI